MILNLLKGFRTYFFATCLAGSISILLPGNFLFAQYTFSYKSMEVQYDSAWTFEDLQLVPIKFIAHAKNPEGPGIINLSEALLLKKVWIKELSRKIVPDKGTLSITNKTDKTILIHSGEMMDGGKQDRVFANTTLIPPRSKKYQVKTFCIEKGRWDDKAQPFVYGGSGDMDLRKIIDTKHSQSSVWKEIDNRYDNELKKSDTWSYLNLSKDTLRGNKEYLDFFLNKYANSGGGLAGFIFITGDKIISTEMFSSPEITDASFKPMVISYINSLSAKANKPAVPYEQQKAFMDKILTSPDGQHKMIRSQGKAYTFQRKTLHIIVYGEK